MRPGSPNVLVLAAFEEVEKATTAAARLKLDKAQLRQLVDQGEVIGFAYAVYDAGHRCDHVDRCAPAATCAACGT